MRYLYRELGNQISENDLRELVDIELSVFKKYKSLYDKNPWDENNFNYVLNKKQALSNLIEANGEIVAFSIAYEFEEYYAHISRVAIKPEYSGKGLGFSLLENQLSKMLQQGFKYCSVDLMVKNFGAYKLYERLGFRTLEGVELESYVNLKCRNADEYVGVNRSHGAMLKIF